MNPNLDFREEIEWGDSTIDPATPPQLALGAAAALITFIVAILVCL